MRSKDNLDSTEPSHVPGGLEWHLDGYVVSTDHSRLDVGTITAFLADSYWAKGIPAEVVRRSIEHSVAFGLYRAGRQVGFARVVTDMATFAWIGDVFVLEEHRGRGLAQWLVRCILAHPELQGLRRWMLATRDAHALYAKAGFAPVNSPERLMERADPDVYRRGVGGR